LLIENLHKPIFLLFTNGLTLNRFKFIYKIIIKTTYVLQLRDLKEEHAK
jgi:hypothetical protein